MAITTNSKIAEYIFFASPQTNPNQASRTRSSKQSQIKMHRFTSISSLCLFLIAITSPSILAASEPQLQRTLRILQDDNNNATNATNDTVPDDATAETNVTAPTAAPQQVTPGATRAPTHAMTHEPTKKYEPEDDEEEKDEEKKHSAFAVGGSIVLIVLGLGILCYFRDAITFFVGSVRMVCIVSIFEFISISIAPSNSFPGMHQYQSLRLQGVFINVFSVHLWFSGWI